MAPPRQPRRVASRFAGRDRVGPHRAAAGCGIRHAGRNAAGIRVVRRNAPGNRRRALGLVVAPRVRADERDVADGLCHGERARGAVHARLRPARVDALSDDRAHQAGARHCATRRARQLHFDDGGRGIYRRRRPPDHRRAGSQFLWPQCAAIVELLHCDVERRVTRIRNRRMDACGGRRHAGRRVGWQALACAYPVHADRHYRRRRARLSARRDARCAGRDVGTVAVGVTGIVGARFFACGMARPRTRSARVDRHWPDRGDLQRPRRRVALRSAHRRQSGVHRTRPRQYRRRVHVELSDFRVV